MYPEKIREQMVDGQGPWFWPDRDTGAWDGPVKDWKAHKETISILKNYRTAIQAGGCCGLYPRLLSPMFKTVITFEPDAQNFHFLKKNVEEIWNVFKFQGALGSENKMIKMDSFDQGNVGTHRVSEEEGDVRMYTIDTMFVGIQEVDLLWFDLEGYEFNALLGSVQTIKANRPLIGLERPTPACVKLLEELDYEMFSKSEMDVFYLPKEFEK